MARLNKQHRRILRRLKIGMTQAEVADHLKKSKLKPNSLRTVELRINEIKQMYNCNTLFELAVRLSDKKINF